MIEFSKCVRRHQVTKSFALPFQPLPSQEAGRGFAESSLHVDDRAILVEHTDLDAAP